jgi:3-dehydroquinate synthase
VDTRATGEPHSVIDAGDYRVTIGRGLRAQFGTSIARAAPAHAYAVVTDSNVAPLYADALVRDLDEESRASLHVIPAGETHKNRESWARVTDELLAAGYGRDTTVVALGGGVVGDLAGFVAATFLRGVPVVQCPTSLLAMIDASVGGKTGVDTPAGKNLVGAFHPPATVLIDVELIGSLPAVHRSAGLAEAIKHGVVASAEHFADLERAIPDLLAGETAALHAAIAASVAIKAGVVCADSREAGLRKTLNFGHTLGHAIEHASGYALLHGECVAIGMVLEARIAERAGIAEAGLSDRIAGLVTRAGLPTRAPASLSARVLLDGTRSDKKARGGVVEYSLPVRIGRMAGADRGYGIPVEDALVLDVLESSIERSVGSAT